MLDICRICLRTDVELRDFSENEELADFHEELCDYSNETGELNLCSECERVLTKCYNFKQICSRADEILRNWKKNKSKDKPPLQELYQNLPQNNVPKLEIENINVDDIKTEIPVEFDENKEHNNGYIVTCTGNDEQTFKFFSINNQPSKTDSIDIIANETTNIDNIDNQMTNNDSIDNQTADTDRIIDSKNVNFDEFDKFDSDKLDKIDDDDDDDDDYTPNDDQNDDDDDDAIEFLSVLKKESKQEPVVKKRKYNKGKKIAKPKATQTKKTTINHGKAFNNQKELETVFDIQIFSSEADAIKHFKLRCSTEPYVSATYRCNVCYTVYQCQKKLDCHMKCHEPAAGDEVCNICQMRYNTNGKLLKHKIQAHYGVFKCKICSLITYYKESILPHYQKHQGVEYKCPHCTQVFSHRNTYLTHLRTSHTSDHICSICAKTFVSEAGLLMHLARTHKKVNMKKKRRMKLLGKETAESKSDVTESTCTECNITFASHAVYIVHILNTPKHKELASAIMGCRFCGLEFNCRQTLLTHKRKLHLDKYKKMNNEKYTFGPEGKTFKCQECGVTGKSSLWLYRHHNSHHPEIPYAQHNEQRKHLCDECGRSFYTPFALREHKYKHSGAKPYHCEQCPAKFRTKNCLKTHAEIHLPPRRECQHCGKKFVSASSLCNHMRAHTGDRSYKCEICGKGFLHNAALKEHVRGVHYHLKRPRKNTQNNYESM